jgi:hypothetical protein
MFIVIDHEIHDADKFQTRAERAMPPPDGLHVHMFLPAKDLSRATCLYEADAVDPVRRFVDGALGDASTNRYIPVAEGAAMGLPARQTA